MLSFDDFCEASLDLVFECCLQVIQRSKDAWIRLEKVGMKLEEERIEVGQVLKKEIRVVVSLSVHRSSGGTRPLER